MKPTIVHVKWSEAAEFKTDEILQFAIFEATAMKAAMSHLGGSYLKTAVIVHFDNGDTYEGRLDLGASEELEKGFEDGIRKRIDFYESPEGQRRLDQSHRAISEAQDHLYEVWTAMDFDQDLTWCWWEAEVLSQPVDTTFCTITQRH